MAGTSGAIEKGTYRLLTPINAVTETTTSDVVNIAGAEKVTFAFTRADHGSGSSAFKVQVSVDGENFFDFNSLIEDQTNTNAQTKERATTITLSADGTTIASMDLEHHHFLEMKVVATETTDGTHTAKALIQY